MDSNNWRSAQSEAQFPMDGGDWRSQLQPESRQRIVNKIMETLKRHLPFSGQEGLQELKQIAIRFEEKIYSAATSQSDYLRKISLKMLAMESKSQNKLPNALPSNAAGVSRNPQDSVPSQNMQSQVQYQSQSVPLQVVPNQTQAGQRLLAQNIQNNIASAGMQTAASLPNSLPLVNGLMQNPMSNVVQNPSLQNISGISQNSVGNTMNQGGASNMFTNAQRQMQGRQHGQQVGPQQQQRQSQNTQQYMYQQQLQLQMLKQKLQGNFQPPPMQTPLQQQQQQQNMLQATPQPIMQTSSVMQPSMISGLQQKQQSSIQQLLQQQPQQIPVIQHQESQLLQQSMWQQPNDVNIQQNQLIGQQSNISDMLPLLLQQQRLLVQRSNLQNLQPQEEIYHQNMHQQHLMCQQNNLSNMHQQQFGHQSRVGTLPQQQQLMGNQSGNANLQTNQHSVHMMQQSKSLVPLPQQSQNASPLLSGGGQQAQSQSQSQQQLMSQIQSQPAQVQQQLDLQQQPNSLQHNMQQQIQNPNSLLQQQNMIDQQKQLFQSHRAPRGAPYTSVDSTAQTGNTNAGDWQEEVYQKIKAMKDMYYNDLNEMCQKISIKLQQHDSLPQQPKMDQLEKLKVFKHMLERLMQVLQTTKNNILPTHRDKLPSFEKQICGLLNSNRPPRSVPSMQQGQVLPSQMQSMQQPQQPHSQISQAHSHDGGVNHQLQKSMNLQGSVGTMRQSNVSSSFAITLCYLLFFSIMFFFLVRYFCCL